MGKRKYWKQPVAEDALNNFSNIFFEADVEKWDCPSSSPQSMVDDSSHSLSAVSPLLILGLYGQASGGGAVT